MNEYDIIDNMVKNGLISPDKVKMDSRQVKKGDVFIASKGVSCDGHDFIDEVIEKDPALIICERVPEKLKGYNQDKVLKVKDSIEVMGYIARNIYDDPASRLKTYGITGTNGKTTTVFLLNYILEKAGRKSGFISTVYIKTAVRDIKKASMTTPGVFEVYSLLDQMVKEGNNTGIIEISSHALSQKRVWGLELDVAVFTNITPEHMDYHKNMESYFIDKAKILDLLKPGASAVLNSDDPLVSTLISNKNNYNCVTFAIENNADFMAHSINMSTGGTSFTLNVRNKQSVEVKTSLIGRHNVYNVLAAAAALECGGVPVEFIVEALREASAPPGRLEPVVLDDPFSVFIDYAHTPNALENVLLCLKELTCGDLICVFGCGGDRDKEKRPVMGKIASDLCDRIILTSDNPRSEDPMEIISEIEKGMPCEKTYSVLADREAAIAEAIKSALAGDIVIIAGKGHEDYQIIGDSKVHFDDKEVAAKVLNKG